MTKAKKIASALVVFVVVFGFISSIIFVSNVDVLYVPGGAVVISRSGSHRIKIVNDWNNWPRQYVEMENEDESCALPASYFETINWREAKNENEKIGTVFVVGD